MAPQVTVYTTSEVAIRFRVDGSTVRKWVALGKLKPAFTTPGGQYRFNLADIDELAGAGAAA